MHVVSLIGWRNRQDADDRFARSHVARVRVAGRRALPRSAIRIRNVSIDCAAQGSGGVNLRSTTPAIVAAVLVLLCGALYLFGDRGSYVWLLSGLGAAPFSFPFLDMHAVMSAVQCHRLGIDVFATNPCDVFGRIHVYSPLWLSLSVLPMTVAWTPVAGLVLVVAFLLSLLLLPAGRGWRQVGIITLATISGSVAFALERANTDLVVFVLAVAVIRLVRLRLAL